MAEETANPQNVEKAVKAKDGTNPLVAGLIIALFVGVLFWWANANGLLPWYTKWQAAKTRSAIEAKAKSVQGDWDKLSDADKKWLDSVTSNHGRMAVMMHGRGQDPRGGMGGPGGPGGGGTSGSGRPGGSGGMRPGGMGSGGMRPGGMGGGMPGGGMGGNPMAPPAPADGGTSGGIPGAPGSGATSGGN